MRLETSVYTLILYLLGFISKCCGQLIGATVGLSTSIQCNGLNNIIDSPPFWIINGTVYELFSIPRLLLFIPVVTNFASLKIPVVKPALNHTTFQCARFRENGLENGTVVELQVFPGDNSPAYTHESELVLNYQELYMRDSGITISWVLNDNCSERFQVQGYTLDTGEPVLSPEHVFDVRNSTSLVLADLASNVSYKLLTLSDNATLCPSNRNIYYRFDESNFFDFSINPIYCIAIPPTATSCPGKALNFVWPARVEGRSCVCPVHNSSAGRRVFESCVKGCRDAVLTPTLTEEGHVCIYNLIFSSLFHFVCSTDECSGGKSCFLQAVIASYMIEEITTDDEHSKARLTTNDFSDDLSSDAEGFPFSYIAVPVVILTLLLLLLLCVCCYCLRKKHLRNRKNIKKCVYNTNYVGVFSQQDTNHANNAENLDYGIESSPPLYEMISKAPSRNADDDQTPLGHNVTNKQHTSYPVDKERENDLQNVVHGNQANSTSFEGEGLYDTVKSKGGTTTSYDEAIYNHLNYNSQKNKDGSTCKIELSQVQYDSEEKPLHSIYSSNSCNIPEPVYSSLQGVPLPLIHHKL